MKLRITTPLTVAVDADGVISLRAVDATGSFGIFPGFADFLTSLTIGVVSWKSSDGSQHFCAVRRGVLSVTGGREIAIATREAIPGDDLASLDETILAHYRADTEMERAERVNNTQLQLNAIRQIVSHLRPNRPRWIDELHMTTSDEQDPLVRGVRLQSERQTRGQRDGDPSVTRRLAQIGVPGWIIVTPMLIGVFAGRWLDRTFNSGLFCTAPLLMLGAAIGCWSAWKWMQTA